MTISDEKILKWQCVKYLLIALWLSLILTLYLSPTKELRATLLAAALLVIIVSELGLWRSRLMSAMRPLGPLVAMLLYVFVFHLVCGVRLDSSFYMQEILIGFVPTLLFYVVFRNLASQQVSMMVLAVLLVPGLIHTAFLYLDILVALQRGDMLLFTSDRLGFLEFVKNPPRVGRRYLSLALLQQLWAGCLLLCYFKTAPLRYLAWGLINLSVLSLALIDARAAYASVIISMALLVSAVGPNKVWKKFKSFLPFSLGGRLLLISFLIAAVLLGYDAGKSRWQSLSYSFVAARHDVFLSEVELTQRPFVNESYWRVPIEDIEACYAEQRFRCKVDQSAYLRFAWLLSGMQSLFEHPWGIGYSNNYMARLWGVTGLEGYYQRVDSFLVEHIVTLGLPGMMSYMLLVWCLVSSLGSAVKAGSASPELVAVSGILFLCVGRALVDTFTDGLWLYAMALLGIYYGLLHSDYQFQNINST